jgi:hypothetical protein
MVSAHFPGWRGGGFELRVCVRTAVFHRMKHFPVSPTLRYKEIYDQNLLLHMAQKGRERLALRQRVCFLFQEHQPIFDF